MPSTTPPVQPAATKRVLRKESIDDRIVTAALAEVVRVGADRIALADVAKVAKVSRTTLYKYYPDRDSLLSGVSERIRFIYASELDEAIKGHDRPADRLRAVIAFMHDFHQRWRADHMIKLRNQSIVEDINRNFAYYNDLLRHALEPVTRVLLGRGMDAPTCDLMVEALIRVQLSNALIPLSADWDRLAGSAYLAWLRIEDDCTARPDTQRPVG